MFPRTIITHRAGLGKQLTCTIAIVGRAQRHLQRHYTSKRPENGKMPLLPSERDARRTDFTKWITERVDNIQAAVFTASQAFNDATGYSAIEKLKKKIELEEQELDQCRNRLRSAKQSYTKAVEKQTASQKEINELLQRKNSWSPEDLERFTELYRNDHVIESEVVKSHATTEALEQELEDHRTIISNLIGSRYHEEQIWSDKIRRVSTWGTWALMALNILVFIIAQLGLEPWRRRRMMDMFENRIKDLVKDEHRVDDSTQKEWLSVGVNPDTDKFKSDDLQGHANDPQSNDLQSNDLQWNNLTQRLQHSIKTSTALIARPEEILYPLAAVSISSFLFGCLFSLAFK